jgi:hypothetical protein
MLLSRENFVLEDSICPIEQAGNYRSAIEWYLCPATYPDDDPDAREHRRAAVCRHQDQGFHSRLPLRRLVLGLRQLRDVVGRILQCEKLPAVRQRDRIIEASFPASIVSHAYRSILNV